MAGKKSGKRDAKLRLSSVARLVKDGARGSINGNARVSKAGAQEARLFAEMFVRKVAQDAVSLTSQIARKKTVNSAIMMNAIEVDNACTVASKDISKRNKSDTKGISMASVIRLFKEDAGDIRMTARSKEILHSGVQAYIIGLGRRGGRIANGGKRLTIQAADIRGATDI